MVGPDPHDPAAVRVRYDAKQARLDFARPLPLLVTHCVALDLLPPYALVVDTPCPTKRTPPLIKVRIRLAGNG